MEALSAYIIKVNIALIFFYLLYVIFLKKDTFFAFRRYFILAATVFFTNTMFFTKTMFLLRNSLLHNYSVISNKALRVKKVHLLISPRKAMQ